MVREEAMKLQPLEILREHPSRSWRFQNSETVYSGLHY
jgi:hypothetical protein